MVESVVFTSHSCVSVGTPAIVDVICDTAPLHHDTRSSRPNAGGSTNDETRPFAGVARELKTNAPWSPSESTRTAAFGHCTSSLTASGCDVLNQQICDQYSGPYDATSTS